MTEMTMTYKFGVKMNEKRTKLKITCLVTLYLSKVFSMKNSFIKNYEEFEGKVCIGYVLWQKK